MKIGLRGGHCAKVKGAMGLRDEYEMMQRLYKEVEKVLIKHGHKVINCNSVNAKTENDDLIQGTKKANANNVDIFLSLHMNAFNKKAYGTEALVNDPNSNSLATQIAKRLCKNYSELGLTNRGAKKSTLHEIKATNMGAIIFETLFCDNKHDIEEVWSPTSYEELARRIANAIDTKIEKTVKKTETRYKVTVSGMTDKKRQDLAIKVLEKEGFNVKAEKYEVEL